MSRARVATRPPKPKARRRVSAWALGVLLLAGAPAGLLASRPPRLLRGHTDDVYALAFSPGGVLASVSGDGTARLWDPAAGRERAALEGHDGLVYGAAFSPDGKALATAGGDGTVRLWDTATHRERQVFKGHEEGVYAVAFSPDGKVLASAGDDRAIRLWDVRGGRPPATLPGHAGKVYGLAFSPDGKVLASSGGDRAVRLWDVSRRRQSRVLRGHTSNIYRLAFSPDGKTLASASQDHTIRLWDVGRGQEAVALAGTGDTVYAVAFSPDGNLLASGGDDKNVRLWDVPGRSPLGVLRGQAAVYAVAFSPDGKALASAGVGQTIRLWDVSDFRSGGRGILGEVPVRKFTGRKQPIDPDGNPDTSFLARIPADTALTFQTLDSDGLVLNMAQTWHQLRPGEIRTDCGGCHAHSQKPTPFERTQAARPDYPIWDLTRRTPLLTGRDQDESGKKWDVQGETGLRFARGATSVEYGRDVRPILERNCVACHTRKSACPAGNLVLDAQDELFEGQRFPRASYRLALDERARYGHKPVGWPTWGYPQASHSIRKFQARRSLLIWKLFGRRLDGLASWPSSANACRTASVLLTRPITAPIQGRLMVSVADRQGNVSRVDRPFSVGEAPGPR